MGTITLKLLDDNPLIPPKCSVVVVRIPANQDVRHAMKNMNLQSKVKYVQRLTQIH